VTCQRPARASARRWRPAAAPREPAKERRGARPAPRRAVAACKRAAAPRKAEVAEGARPAADRTPRWWVAARWPRTPTGLSSEHRREDPAEPRAGAVATRAAARAAPDSAAEGRAGDPIAEAEHRRAAVQAGELRSPAAGLRFRQMGSGPQENRPGIAADRSGRALGAAPGEPAEVPMRALQEARRAAEPGAADKPRVADTREAVPTGAEPAARRAAGYRPAEPEEAHPTAAAEAPELVVHRAEHKVGARLRAGAQEPQGFAPGPEVHRKTGRTCWSAGCWRHTACRRS